MYDPIVEEIHETRRRMFEQAGNDLSRYLQRIKSAESADKDRLVTKEQLEQRALNKESARPAKQA